MSLFIRNGRTLHFKIVDFDSTRASLYYYDLIKNHGGKLVCKDDKCEDPDTRIIYNLAINNDGKFTERTYSVEYIEACIQHDILVDIELFSLDAAATKTQYSQKSVLKAPSIAGVDKKKCFNTQHPKQIDSITLDSSSDDESEGENFNLEWESSDASDDTVEVYHEELKSRCLRRPPSIQLSRWTPPPSKSNEIDKTVRNAKKINDTYDKGNTFSYAKECASTDDTDRTHPFHKEHDDVLSNAGYMPSEKRPTTPRFAMFGDFNRPSSPLSDHVTTENSSDSDSSIKSLRHSDLEEIGPAAKSSEIKWLFQKPGIDWQKQEEQLINQLKTKRAACRRKIYEDWEIQGMIWWILRHNGFRRIRRLETWQKMHDQGFLRHRRPSSLLHHFSTFFFKDLRSYKVPRDWRYKFFCISRLLKKSDNRRVARQSLP